MNKYDNMILNDTADSRDFLPYGPCGTLDKSISLLRDGGGGGRGDYAHIDGSSLDENVLRLTGGAEDPRVKFVVVQKNARCLSSDDDIEELLHDLRETEWDVVLISETWREEHEECIVLSAGHVWFGCGGQKKRGGAGYKHGVGILIHRR